MSEDYVKDTHGDIGRELGTSSDHSAQMEMDDFIWEDVSYYITAMRLLSRVANYIGPVSDSPSWIWTQRQLLLCGRALAAFISKDGAKHQWYQATKRLALQCKESPLT